MQMSTLAINGGKPVVEEGTIKPWPWITQQDRDAVVKALDTAVLWGVDSSRVPNVCALEAGWADYVGTDYCIAANSGTAALHMAVGACGIGPGDEVIVPALTFTASASCVLHHNGIPIFVDAEPGGCNIDPRRIEEKINDRTKGIVAVDLLGLPADVDPINEIAKRHKLVVIEDTSQAHGALYKGRKVGSLGDIGAGSIQASKLLPAGGEGGLLTTSNEEYRDKAHLVRTFGEQAVAPGMPREYNAMTMGWNYRMSELVGAVAYSQFTRFDQLLTGRQKNCEYLSSRLSQMPGIDLLAIPDDRTCAYFFFTLLVESEQIAPDVEPVKATEALHKMLVAEGVPVCRWLTMAVPSQQLFQDGHGYGKGCPWTCEFARRGIDYRAETYPETERMIARALYLGHEGGGIAPPNDERLMDLYASAFEKVLVDHRDELIRLAQRDDG